MTQGVSSFPSNFYTGGTWSLFYANDGVHPTEPWATNGTAGGTFTFGQVTSQGGAPLPTLQVGSRAFVFAPQNTGQTNIWVTDGTPAGTHLVGDATGDPNWTNISPLLAFGSKAVFIARNASATAIELWLSDGVNPSVHVPSASGQAYMAGPAVVANGYIYFLASSGTNTPLQPWISDGTSANTVPLAAVPNAALDPDPTVTSPTALVQVGNYLLFIAYTTTSGRELWRIDLRTNAISQVADIAPGTTSGVLDMHIGALGNAAVFTAAADGTTAALWRTDGTAAGTYSVAPARPDSNRFPVYVGSSGNSRLLFWVAVTNGDQLWATDGTAAGTVQLPVSSPAVDNAYQLGSSFYGCASPASGPFAWRSDGTVAGTQVLTGIPVGAGCSIQFAGDDSMVFVRITDQVTPTNSLYVYSPGSGTSSKIGTYTRNFLPAGGLWGFTQGLLYFDNEDLANGREPWTSDGTVAGTHILLDIAPETQTRPSNPSGFAELNGVLYFAADDGVHGNELWKSDGTAGGTQLVADLNPGSAASNPTDLFVAGGSLYFFATDASGSVKFWKSNGTAAGTAPLATVAPVNTIECETQGVAVGGVVFFPGSDPTLRAQLWKTDGTPAGTIRVSNITGPAASSSPVCNLTSFNGKVFFEAASNTYNNLWISDGTTAGTGPLYDTAGDPLVSPWFFVQNSGSLFFVARDGALNGHLWQTDGTPAGTHQVPDFSAGQVLGVYGPIAGELLVRVQHGGVDQFWITGATASARVQIGPELAQSDAFVNNDVAYLAGQQVINGFSYAELWASDGTATGTRNIIQVPSQNMVQGSFADFRGQTMVQIASSGVGAWLRTDGTATGTFDTLAAPVGSAWGEAGQNFFYVGNDGTTGNELWAISNDPPVVANVNMGSVVTGQSITANLLANDRDPDGSLKPASLTIITKPTGGTVSVGANGQVTYTANAGFTGTDTFTYTVADMQGLASQPAIVQVTVVAAASSGGGSTGGGGKGGGGSLGDTDLLLLAAAVCLQAMRRRLGTLH